MGNLDNVISITIAFTIVAAVGFVQEYRLIKSLEALNQLVPHNAPKVNQIAMGLYPFEAVSTTTLASNLVVEDLVRFSTGDKVPADNRITKAVYLSIDESNLTRENEPASKQVDSLERPPIPWNAAIPTDSLPSPSESSAAGIVRVDIRMDQRTNIAFMDTLVRSGHREGLLIGTGTDTEFGGVPASLQEIESPRTPLQLSMHRLGQELRTSTLEG